MEWFSVLLLLPFLTYSVIYGIYFIKKCKIQGAIFLFLSIFCAITLIFVAIFR